MDFLLLALGVFLYLIPAGILIGYGGWISVIDFKTHRLPNKHVARLTGFISLVILMLCAFQSDWRPAITSLVTSGLMTLAYIVLYFASRGGLGMGDVKFAIPNGLVLGYYGLPGSSSLVTVVQCILLTFVLAGVVAGVGILAGRLDRKSRIAFGPYMTAATSVMIAVSSLN